jgi:hypothetical protein
MDYRLYDVACISIHKSYDFTKARTIPLRNIVLQNNFANKVNNTLSVFSVKTYICDIETSHSSVIPNTNV